MRHFLLPIVLILQLALFAQNEDVENIKSNSEYLWGEAKASSLYEADQLAVQDLVSQISTSIESKFLMVLTEDEEDIEEFTESAVSTYTNTTLNQANRKVIEDNDGVYVIRYMKKTNADKIFKEREQKIIDYARLGIKARDQMRAGDALRYYYWSLALLRSHPDANSIRFSQDDNDYAMFPWLIDEINGLLSSISVDIIAHKADTSHLMFMLDITVLGMPVQNLDYIFWTGDTYSNLYSCKDGKAVVEFFGNYEMPESLKLRIEYRYDNKASLDPEVEQVLKTNIIPAIKKAVINIPNPYYYNEEKIVEQIKKPTDTDNSSKSFKDKPIQLVENIVAKMNTGDTALCKYFTDGAYKEFRKIAGYGVAKILPHDSELKAIEFDAYHEVRSVPMRFSFPNNKRSFVDDLVFVINDQNLISGVRFAISDKAINDILSKSERFGSDFEKYFLIGFMEKYKTAYTLEDIGFIEKVFAENALIIVGEVIAEPKTGDAFYRGLDEYQIEYQRYTKSEYVSHLKEIFEANAFVNIQLEDNEVRKVNGNDMIYGIQIKQNYYSSRYSDQGYLFLMIDLNEVSNPTIYVRTWQPDKHNNDKLYGLEDFSF
ncbi:MAG TPA: hypothetical protein PLO05_05305 [Bacteroidales bacterium]|nr:hypothetical protein [Bacteroidales bacterium]